MMKRPIQIAAILPVLVLLTTSCTTWHQVGRDALPKIERAIRAKQPATLECSDHGWSRSDEATHVVMFEERDRLRLEGSNGEELFEARLLGLEIDGAPPSGVATVEPTSGATRQFPVSHVAKVEVGEEDPAGTLLAVAGVTVGTLLAVVVVGFAAQVAYCWNHSCGQN